MNPRKLHLTDEEVRTHWFTKSYVTNRYEDHWYPEPGNFGFLCHAGLVRGGFLPPAPWKVRLVLSVPQPSFDTPHEWAYAPVMSWWVIHLLTRGIGFKFSEPRLIDRSIYPGVWWRPEWEGRIRHRSSSLGSIPMTREQYQANRERNKYVHKAHHANFHGELTRFKKKERPS